jgi:large subunit ribosomal protein L21
LIWLKIFLDYRQALRVKVIFSILEVKMFAILETGGKQFRVREGQQIKVAKLADEAGSEIVMDKILAAGNQSEVKFGQPYVEGARVVCDVLSHERAKKIIVFKKKRRKGYSKKQGHRQDFTRLRVKTIEA